MNGHTVAYYITGYINIISEHIPLNVRFHPHWPYFYRRFEQQAISSPWQELIQGSRGSFHCSTGFNCARFNYTAETKKSPRFLSVEVSLFQMVHIFILCPERHSMRAFHGKQCLKSVGLYRPSAVKWAASSFFLGEDSCLTWSQSGWIGMNTNRNPQFWSNLSFVKLWFIS